MKIKENKALKVIIITIIVIIAMSQVSIAATTGTITSDTVRVREKASTSSDIVALVSIGDKVDVLEKSGDWYKVSCKYEGKDVIGYIRGDLINVKDESSLTQTNPPTQTEPTDVPNTQEPADVPSTPQVENPTQEPSTPTQEGPQENPNTQVPNQAETTLKTNQNIEVDGTIALTSDINIKILPLVNSTNIATITSGTQVTVVEIINKWARIETGDLIGWVRIEQ